MYKYAIPLTKIFFIYNACYYETTRVSGYIKINRIVWIIA